LQNHLLLIELLNSLRVDISVEIRSVENRRLRRLFNPQIFRWLEIISEYGYDFLDLLVAIFVDKEVKLLIEIHRRGLSGVRKGALHGLGQVLVLLLRFNQNLLVDLELVGISKKVRSLRQT